MLRFGTMIDVVICRSLDPDTFPRVPTGTCEKFVQTQGTRKASLKRPFVLYRSRQMRKTQIVGGFLFLLFVHGMFSTRLVDFFWLIRDFFNLPSFDF